MGIRETLNQNPAITTGATIGIIVIAIGFIVWQVMPSSPDIPTKGYYTTDDSSQDAAMAAMFVDKIDRITPFDKDGKKAFKANVFSCDGGKTKFIGWIERYTDAAKTKLEAAQGNPQGDMMALEEVRMTGLEVKKPGDKNWVKFNNQTAFSAAQELKCPGGGTENIEMQLPR